MASVQEDVEDAPSSPQDQQNQHYQEDVLLLGLIGVLVGLLQVLVGVLDVLVGGEEFLLYEVEVLALVLDLDGHVVHDVVDPVDLLLDLVDHLVLLEDYLPLQLVVNLHVLLHQLISKQGLLLFLVLVRVDVAVVHRPSLHVPFGLLLIDVPASRSLHKGSN